MQHQKVCKSDKNSASKDRRGQGKSTVEGTSSSSPNSKGVGVHHCLGRRFIQTKYGKPRDRTKSNGGKMQGQQLPLLQREDAN